MGTIGNINLRVGSDISELTASMKLAQNTIANFKDSSLQSLKSFGLPHLNTTNLVESIQSGQRTIVNFSRESSESLAQFQTRVRTVFEEVGIDISAYEKILENAGTVHADFAKGALRNFSAVADSASTYTSATMTKFNDLKATLSGAFAAIGDSSVSMAGKIAIAGDIINTALPELFALGLAVMFVDKVIKAGEATMNFAAETQDAQRQFTASMGTMSDDAEQFTRKLSESYGVSQEALKKMVSTEFMNANMLGFDPKQAEDMSEHITQLSYDLGKLRGVDPSEVFQSLQSGLEGQTRGLKSLGIVISENDLKNRALSEGIIKQGQEMTDAQKSLVAYQEIMAKAGDTAGYYATQADTLSNKQAKVSADFEAMKINLVDSLIPALNGLKNGLVWVEEEFITFGNNLSTVIKYITLFAEDASAVITDLFAMNFSNLGEQFAANIQSAFYSTSTAANEAATSTDTLGASTDGLNDKQKALGKSLKDNIMSFDQLHNITPESDSGSGGSGGGSGVTPPTAPSVPNVPAGLANSLGKLGNDKNNGVAIPIVFGPVPPFPTIPTPPAVPVAVSTVAAAAAIAAWVAATTAELEGFETATELGLATWATVTEGILAGWATVTELGLAGWATVTEGVLGAWETATELGLATWATVTELCLAGWETLTEAGLAGWATITEATLAGWETITELGLATWATVTEATLAGWATVTELELAGWATLTELGLATWATVTEGTLAAWALATELILSPWAIATELIFAGWETANLLGLATWGPKFEAAFSEVLTVTETMAKSWVVDIENSFSSGMNSAVTSATNAFNTIKSLISDNMPTLQTVGKVAGAAALGAGIVGLTVATGGADVLAAGAASAVGAIGTAIGGMSAGGLATGGALAAGAGTLAVNGYATGGIVTVPQLAMIAESKPEAIIPLDRLDSMLSSNSTPSGASSGSGSGSSQPVNVTLQIDGRTLARIMNAYNVNETDRLGTTIGYNSSYNLPK